MQRTIILTAALLVLAPAAWAAHPDYRQMNEVRALAHALEEAAGHAHAAAERDSHHYDRAERRALRDLHLLDDRARHFHRQAERYRRDPIHTERDFERLLDAYHQARSSFRFLHARRHVRSDFYGVDRLIRELSYFYEDAAYGHHRGRHGRFGYHGRYRSHGRW